MIWKDAAGRSWEIIDFTVRLATGKKKRVELGDWSADGRAFVPHEWEGPVMLYEFGRVAYRDTGARTLENQLAMAKRSTATPGERMQPNQKPGR